MPIESGSQFLKEKYDLHNAPEVEAAADRTNTRNELNAEEGEEVETIGQNPAERIENYLQRFAEITERDDPEKRQRGIEAIKQVIHDKFVIKPEAVPESAFLLEQRIARELGHGDIEITDEFKERKIQQIINDQEHTLDKWIDYLASEDADYPDWAKYWVIRSVLEMGKLEKKEDEEGRLSARFTTRGKDTVAAFAPMNTRALALAVSVVSQRVEEKQKPKTERQPVENKSKKLTDPEFQQLLATESFSKLYTQFLIELPQYSAEGLQETQGNWVMYPQNSDPTPLVDSLEGYPLEWCTAAYDTAQTQLEGGDFYVYYSIDEEGQAKVPRAAIRMSNNSIAEVRGIAPEQNLDPYIADVVREKMAEFPDGKIYEKKAYDMQMVTHLERKTQGGHELNKDDLVFLYEINSPIQGFGYERDPRIAELRANRIPEEDMLVVFEYEPNQIAHSVAEMNQETKAYVGHLEPGIFDVVAKFPQLEHLYTEFPESKIDLIELEIGGKTVDQLKSEMKERKIDIPYSCADILEKVPILTDPEKINLLRLKVGDLGFTEYPTTDQLFARAQELGLELCPTETGLHQRLQDTDQPLDNWYRIATKQLIDVDGLPRFIRLGHDRDGLWLDDGDFDEPTTWKLELQFVFRLRKDSPEPKVIEDRPVADRVS